MKVVRKGGDPAAAWKMIANECNALKITH